MLLQFANSLQTGHHTPPRSPSLSCNSESEDEQFLGVDLTSAQEPKEGREKCADSDSDEESTMAPRLPRPAWFYRLRDDN